MGGAKEEIISFTKIAVRNGIDKVRVTGGEPLTRKNIAYLVQLLANIDGIKDLSLTTNGILSVRKGRFKWQ
jgi:cyclic pyranopterin phosphate synthase